MNIKHSTEEASLSLASAAQTNDNHKRGRSLGLGSFRMISKKNIIAVENKKKLRSKIIPQEHKDNDINIKSNMMHFSKSLSPKPKSKNTNSIYLLPVKTTKKKTLVLDLDETLVHSSFEPFGYPADIVIKIDIEGQKSDVYVLIRPGVREFLKRTSEVFELVLFTASLSSYANPVMNIIDRDRLCAYRLYREHCTLINSIFLKELKKLNRDMRDVVIVDNSPLAYICNKDNGIPIESWYENSQDRELDNLIPILKFLSEVDDVREYIPRFVFNNEISYVKANYVIRKDEYETKANGSSNNTNTANYIKNQFGYSENQSPATTPGARRKKKRKFYLKGDNSNIKIFKPLININIVNNNISNNVNNKIYSNNNRLKESLRSESNGDLMKYSFFKEKNDNTPTLRNNIVLNYQAMKRRIKPKKHSEGDSLVFSIKPHNVLSVLPYTHDAHAYSQNCNKSSSIINNTSSNIESNKNNCFIDIQQYTNNHHDHDHHHNIDRPITGIRLNAFRNNNPYNKSAINYFQSNTNITTASNRKNKHKTKTNSFSSTNNDWRNMSNYRLIPSKKITTASQLKELRVDSNDTFNQRFKPNKTSRYCLKK